jgi:hypothetical protein
MWLDSDVAASQVFITTDCRTWETIEAVAITNHAADLIPNLPASRISLQSLGFALSISDASGEELGMGSTLHVIAEGCKGTSCLLTWYFSATRFDSSKIRVARLSRNQARLPVTFAD